MTSVSDSYFSGNATSGVRRHTGEPSLYRIVYKSAASLEMVLVNVSRSAGNWLDVYYVSFLSLTEISSLRK